jgi:hypothetical protein
MKKQLQEVTNVVFFAAVTGFVRWLATPDRKR